MPLDFKINFRLSSKMQDCSFHKQLQSAFQHNHVAVEVCKSGFYTTKHNSLTFQLQRLDQGIIYNSKIKQQHEVVKKYFAEINEGIKPVVNVLQVIRMEDKAQNCVKVKSTANCFFKKQADILNHCEVSNCNDAEGNLNDIYAFESINEQWRLISNTLQVDPMATINHFI